jgi:EmrB/QacA subfamily drug resistance transporter
VAGPIVGGAVTQGLAWQWIFWLNVPIGLAAIPFVLARIDESHGPAGRRLDLAGLVLVTGAGLGVVWGLVRGNSAGWTSGEVLGALIGGAALLAAFIVWELRTQQPMLPMRLFRKRAFTAGNLIGMLMFGGLYAAVFFMAQYMQVVLGFSPLGTGLRLIPWTGMVLFLTPLAGALVDRIGERLLAVAGLSLQAAGFIWIALEARTGLPYSHLIAPLALAGIGISLAIPPAQSAVIGAVAPTEIGQATGTFSTLRQFGGVLGVAVAVATFGGAGRYGDPTLFTDGFGPAIGVAGGLSLLGAFIGLALNSRRLPSMAAALDPAGA